MIYSSDMSHHCVPLIKCAGGKKRLLKAYERFFTCKCRHYYIEPFVGGGAVFMSLVASDVKAWINDANNELITMYRIVRNRPVALMEALDVHAAAFSHDYYYQVRARTPDDDVGVAARFMFLNKTCFNGLYRQNRDGQFNVPFNHALKCPALYNRHNVLAISERLQRMNITHGDFESVIDAAREDDVVYCDPPYAYDDDKQTFTGYVANGFTTADQRRLKDACIRARDRGARIIVSNADCATTRMLYADSRKIHVINAYRSIGRNAFHRNTVTELLIEL